MPVITTRRRVPFEALCAFICAAASAHTRMRTGPHPRAEAPTPAGPASGQAATAHLDGFPDHPFQGRVVAISPTAEFTPRIALTEKERADLVFGVKVALEDTTGMLKAGLPATVEIHSGRGL